MCMHKKAKCVQKVLKCHACMHKKSMLGSNMREGSICLKECFKGNGNYVYVPPNVTNSNQ